MSRKLAVSTNKLFLSIYLSFMFNGAYFGQSIPVSFDFTFALASTFFSVNNNFNNSGKLTVT